MAKLCRLWHWEKAIQIESDELNENGCFLKFYADKYFLGKYPLLIGFRLNGIVRKDVARTYKMS